jgi:hypothetical protein
MISDRNQEVPSDPTEEIKAIRHQLGAQFNYDLALIFPDIERRQKESGRTYINLPPRRVVSRATND